MFLVNWFSVFSSRPLRRSTQAVIVVVTWRHNLPFSAYPLPPPHPPYLPFGVVVCRAGDGTSHHSCSLFPHAGWFGVETPPLRASPLLLATGGTLVRAVARVVLEFGGMGCGEGLYLL